MNSTMPNVPKVCSSMRGGTVTRTVWEHAHSMATEHSSTNLVDLRMGIPSLLVVAAAHLCEAAAPISRIRCL